MSLRIRAISIDEDAQLSSSNVTETTAYSAVATYAEGNTVSYNHRLWEAIYNGAEEATFTFSTGDVDTSLNSITETAHGMANGTRVSFTSSGTLPGGLSASTLYYVVLRFTNTFKVSTTLNGSPVNITSQGSGTHTCHKNPLWSTPPSDDSTDWMDIGPSEKWAMFDASNATQSTRSTSMAVAIAPGSAFDSLLFFNLTNVSSIRIQVDSSPAYDQTYSLADTGWSDSETTYFSKLGVSDIPTNGTTATLTFSGSGTLGVGGVVPGLSKNIGSAVYGTGVGITNYSQFPRDEFGNIDRVERGYSDRGQFRMMVAKERGESMIALFTQRRAEYDGFLMAPDSNYPGGWRPSGIFYGFVNSFEKLFSFPLHDEFTLEIEGVT